MYRRVLGEGGRQTCWAVGHYSTDDGWETLTYFPVDHEDKARREVHYLNGGCWHGQEEAKR